MSMAIILAHPQMNAEQACNVARRDGLLLVHNPRTGNYLFEPAAPQFHGSTVAGLHPDSLAADAAVPLEAA